MTNDLIVIDDDKVALIKRTVAKDATDDELALFLHQARKMGLDPLARQIHFQKYKNKKTGKSNVSFITTIDGYRLIADRTGKYAGNGEPVFEGEINSKEYGAGNGPNIPAKATVTVYKIVGGYVREFSNSAYWQEYYPGEWRGHMWRKMPHVMLAKVAEAGALRKAFPADLSGAYTADEMEQAHVDVVVTPESAAVIDTKREIESLAVVVDHEPEHKEDVGKPDEPLPDDEQVIIEASAGEFLTVVTALIDRYTHEKHTQNAMKQLGYDAIPGKPEERRLAYLRLKELAAVRDTEDADKETEKINEALFENKTE